MTTKKIVGAALGVAIGITPTLTVAQTTSGFAIEGQPAKEPPKIYTGFVEAGVGYNSGDSFKFGEYNGLQSDGPFGIANILVRRRAAYDSGDTDYYEVTGTNLGLESRSAKVEIGQQGKFKVFFVYDQIPHYRFEDGRTPFNGAGDSNLTLPGGWVAATSTAGLAALNGNLKNVDIKTERMKFGGGFSWNFAPNWEANGSFQRERKDGTEAIAGIFGFAGGGPSGPLAAILPQPVDQTTDKGELNVAYTGKKLQANFSYNFSFYRNDELSLTWDNPYNALGGWDPSQDFVNGGQGRLALAPDNSAHQLAFSLGYTLDPKTRIAGSFSYGVMLQRDDFLPYTINSSLLVPTPLPRSNLDGLVHKYHANLTVTNRPTRKLDLKGQYRFDMRDNDTPRDVYLTVPADSTGQGTLTGDRARVNLPYSHSSHKASFDAGYRLMPSIKLNGGYEIEFRTRTYSEVDRNHEHTGRVKARFTPSPYVSGSVGYAGSLRRGSSYQSNQPFLDSHSDQHITTLAASDRFQNDPDLRKFNMSDRDRHEVNAAVMATPIEPLTLGLSARYRLDDYVGTSIGLTRGDSIHTAMDLSYQATRSLSFSTFFSYDQLNNVQDGYSRSGGPFPPGSPRSTGSLWEVESKDQVYTAGVGAHWKPIKDKLGIRLDYLFSIAFTEIEPDSPGLAHAELPDLETRLHALSVSGEYSFTESTSVRIGYRYEWFRSKDFALDDVNPDTVGQVLALGNAAPDYTAHVVGVSAKYKF